MPVELFACGAVVADVELIRCIYRAKGGNDRRLYRPVKTGRVVPASAGDALLERRARNYGKIVPSLRCAAGN